MAGGISVHVVDITRGLPAAGMRVEVYRLDGGRMRLAEGALDARGLFGVPPVEMGPAGRYEVVFHVGAFYRGQGHALAEPPFLDEVPFRFGVADPDQPYHLPLKLSPWGFSLFRGASATESARACPRP